MLHTVLSWQIPGQPPSLLHPPKGCAFNPRCPYVFDRCREELPELRTGVGAVGEGHRFRCHLAEEERARIWEAKKAALAAEGSAA